MQVSQEIRTAMYILQLEHKMLLLKIERLRALTLCTDTIITVESFEELIDCYARRDRLANVISNLKALYAW